MQNGVFLFSVFSIVWVVVFGYVLVLMNRQRKLQKELDSLKASLKEKQD